MGSKHLGADVNIAWPTAQIAVTGAAGAVSILYRKELAGLTGDDLAAKRRELQQHYEDTLANPYIAADRGYIDGVIPPSHTRGHLGRALRMLATKRVAAPARKPGTTPLGPLVRENQCRGAVFHARPTQEAVMADAAEEPTPEE